MILPSSVCIFHNGNSRVVELYKEKYSNLEFAGNWATSDQTSDRGRLYEICYADANWDNLMLLRNNRTRIIRHISTYQDDQKYQVTESESFDPDTWLVNVVLPNLCFANEIHCDFVHPSGSNPERILITTGRTANTNVIDYLAKVKNIASFECSKSFDQRFVDAETANLIWRVDQWECLASIWIARYNGFHHKMVDQDALTYSPVPPIDENWINIDWRNMCLDVFDRSLFFKYVLGKHLGLLTTEFVVGNYPSMYEKIPYDKSELIPLYAESKSKYIGSNVNLGLNLLFKNVKNHIITQQLTQE